MKKFLRSSFQSIGSVRKIPLLFVLLKRKSDQFSGTRANFCNALEGSYPHDKLSCLIFCNMLKPLPNDLLCALLKTTRIMQNNSFHTQLNSMQRNQVQQINQHPPTLDLAGKIVPLRSMIKANLQAQNFALLNVGHTLCYIFTDDVVILLFRFSKIIQFLLDSAQEIGQKVNKIWVKSDQQRQY